MRTAIVTCGVLLTVFAAATAHSGELTIDTLVLEGDTVPGVGNVTSIANLAVNGTAQWLVEADTDFANTDEDGVLLGNSGLVLRENDPLPQPPGAFLDSFDSINLNENGDSGFNFFLDGTAGTTDNSGVYFNTTLVIQESNVSTAPEFTPGTPYIGFFDVKMNDSNQMLVVASVDDVAIPTTVDRALVQVDVDNAGTLLSESVFFKEGDVLPGQVEAIADFGTGPHQSAWNNSGEVLFFGDLEGATDTDGVIYLGGTLLAQEGSPSPIAGRNYQFLSSRGLDLNNAGGTVFKANLDGDTADDELLVKDGAVFRREGDTLPAIAGFQLTSFGTGSGPVQIDDDGNVVWYGDWNDPDTDKDTGLFWNDELLVQEGVTTVDGLLVDTIASGSDAFMLSDNGAWLIFEATLEGGLNGAFLIDLGGVVPVELSSFELIPLDGAVHIAWTTSFETRNLGFHVHRALAETGTYARINDAMVTSQGARGEYLYIDDAVEPGATYSYRLEAIGRNGESDTFELGAVRAGTVLPRRLVLHQNHPNPFNPSTRIAFELPEATHVLLRIFDATGREVRTLVDEVRAPDAYVVDWQGVDQDGAAVGAGVYFYELRAGGQSSTRSMVLLK